MFYNLTHVRSRFALVPSFLASRFKNRRRRDCGGGRIESVLGTGKKPIETRVGIGGWEGGVTDALPKGVTLNT